MKAKTCLKLLLGLSMFVSAISAESSEAWLDEMIDAVSRNSSLEQYTDCLLGKAKCSITGETIKDTLQGYITSSCRHCLQNEKQKLCRLITMMEEKQQKLLEAIMNQYGPKAYRRNLSGCQAFLRRKPLNQN